MRRLIVSSILMLAMLMAVGCVPHTTGDTEVGVRTRKIALFSPKGVEKSDEGIGAFETFGGKESSQSHEETDDNPEETQWNSHHLGYERKCRTVAVEKRADVAEGSLENALRKVGQKIMPEN